LEVTDLATVTVYGGDFNAGKFDYFYNTFSLGSDGRLFREKIKIERLISLEIVSLESDGRNTLSTVGRALIGEVIAGPLGALIGAGTAKGRNQVTFLVTFDDNRQLLGATDSETFNSWSGYLLTRKRLQEREADSAAAKASKADELIARYVAEQKAPPPLPELPPQDPNRQKERQIRGSAIPAFGKRKPI
jgi:hypothetical protein